MISARDEVECAARSIEIAGIRCDVWGVDAES
jgi:hypothetical protein